MKRLLFDRIQMDAGNPAIRKSAQAALFITTNKTYPDMARADQAIVRTKTATDFLFIKSFVVLSFDHKVSIEEENGKWKRENREKNRSGLELLEVPHIVQDIPVDLFQILVAEWARVGQGHAG